MRRALAAFVPELDALCDRIVAAAPGDEKTVVAGPTPG